jgi:biopolymer transport protein ExbD
MKRFDNINVIPFIDIMLVLLAIVLTTATFIAQGRLDIALPQAKSQDRQADEPPVELAIDRREQFYLDAQPVDVETLEQRLGQLPVATPVVLRVDTEVRFARFVTLVDLLKLHRLERLTILTQNAP